MQTSGLTAAYRVIGELLLHPDQRDPSGIEARLGELGCAPPAIAEPLDAFLGDPGAWSPEEYVHTLELSPPCPLYLGVYLFDEPKTCRDVGVSGRNAYMLELNAVYRHFGFELAGGELPDYLPAMVDFLWISVEHRERDRIGLRRRFVEQYLRPGLAPLEAALAKHDSPYVLVLSALEAAIEEDLRQMAETPAWTPPAATRRRTGRQLPVLGDRAPIAAAPEEAQP